MYLNTWDCLNKLILCFFGNLKADVPSNSIYQHKTNINSWAGVQWDIDAHMGP